MLSVMWFKVGNSWWGEAMRLTSVLRIQIPEMVLFTLRVISFTKQFEITTL